MDDKVIVDLLGQVGNLFTSSLELKETIDFMLKAASDLVECDAATVFLLEEDGTALSAIATFPFTESLGQVARFELGEGIVGWAAQRRKVVSVADATKDRRFKSLDLAYAPRSCLVMPLESPQRLVGAMMLTRREVQPFTTIEQALMQIIASQAAISIDNARLYAAQQRQLAEIASQKREVEIANAQIAEISRLKSEFLANMSHELRTPLNAILGFSEILKDNLVDLTAEQRQECLENIHTSGKHLLELVNDVLDLSKIEAGRMELSYDRFGVLSAVKEVHNVIRSLSERRDIDLSIKVVPEDLSVRADKSKFKQVLYNLLSNAIKFTAQGGKVWVSGHAERDDLVVTVGDTGVGIPAEHHARIFDEFYQLDTATTRQVEGTGLGLSLTRRLVELHGGGIGLKSEPGKGSEFTFNLPLAGLEATNGDRHNRILLVEDNASNRELAKMVLVGKGFHVDIATDGDEGLHKARSQVYDLVLMDIELPGKDGLTVTRMLRSDPKTASVPIVALTANAMKGNEQEALAAGCTGYISKPIEVANFVQRISTYLDNDEQ
ncbi:MAG: response regulator [Candidatus Dormibacteraeota bacterium]|nr:response regulator [Candidatus Dormibacteraeota bacterium]MBV9526530.1 response regulator [Candidatus Dormibacteraeota bacterium]